MRWAWQNVFQLFWKFIYFRDFSYDLGIRRSPQKAARGATTRPQKYRNFHSVPLVYISDTNVHIHTESATYFRNQPM